MRPSWTAVGTKFISRKRRTECRAASRWTTRWTTSDPTLVFCDVGCASAVPNMLYYVVVDGPWSIVLHTYSRYTLILNYLNFIVIYFACELALYPLPGSTRMYPHP